MVETTNTGSVSSSQLASAGAASESALAAVSCSAASSGPEWRSETSDGLRSAAAAAVRI